MKNCLATLLQNELTAMLRVYHPRINLSCGKFIGSCRLREVVGKLYKSEECSSVHVGKRCAFYRTERDVTPEMA